MKHQQIKKENKPVKLHSVIVLCVLFLFTLTINSQNVAINTTGVIGNASAMLDINSTNTGLLIPRIILSATNIAAPVVAPATSLLVYNTATAGVSPNNVTPGYYYWDGIQWVRITTNPVGGFYWSTLGNAATVDGTNFLGTTDNIPLNFRVNNQRAGRIDHLNFNTFLGYQSGNVITTGQYNSALGNRSLYSNTTGGANVAIGNWTLYNNLSGGENTAVGNEAMYSNTNGYFNTAIGTYSLYNNTTGNYNTASGHNALATNTTGEYLSAFGTYALRYNTLGVDNSAFGYATLLFNTIGSQNSAFGNESLRSNTTGSNNSAVGTFSLYSNTTGNFNTATGYNSLGNNSTGIENTSNGSYSLLNNISGNYNSSFGYRGLFSNSTGGNNSSNGHQALYSNTTGNNNTSSGSSALYSNTTGSGNTAFGYNAFLTGTTFNNSTALGNQSVITASNQIRIGNAAVTSIGGQVGWTTVSDKRVKSNIVSNIPGLAFIMALQPVSYNYDLVKEMEILGVDESLNSESSNNVSKTLYTGFLAQDVDSVAQVIGYDFSGIDKSGSLWGLRYAEFVVPIVKAVQEQQKIIENQQNTIDLLIQRIDDLENKKN